MIFQKRTKARNKNAAIIGQDSLTRIIHLKIERNYSINIPISTVMDLKMCNPLLT